jgi:hypothetical protein
MCSDILLGPRIASRTFAPHQVYRRGNGPVSRHPNVKSGAGVCVLGGGALGGGRSTPIGRPALVSLLHARLHVPQRFGRGAGLADVHCDPI